MGLYSIVYNGDNLNVMFSVMKPLSDFKRILFSFILSEKGYEMCDNFSIYRK